MIKQFRSDISDLMIRIPRFIDAKKPLDYAVWNNMRYVNEILLQLITVKIIKVNTIKDLVEIYEHELDIISDITDDIEKVINYYNLLLEYILEKSLEQEMYETATNIRNFITEQKTKFRP